MRLAKWKNRTEGQEAPYIPFGPFKIRLPFIHYRFEWPDYIQGLLMCAVDLAAIPLLTTLLGMPFEVALAIVVLNGLFYLTHHLLGDPCVRVGLPPPFPSLFSTVRNFLKDLKEFTLLLHYK